MLSSLYNLALLESTWVQRCFLKFYYIFAPNPQLNRPFFKTFRTGPCSQSVKAAKLQCSVGGPVALLSQLVTTVSVTHWKRIEHHDYCSKQALSSSVYSLITHIHRLQRNLGSVGKHCRIVPHLVFFYM